MSVLCSSLTAVGRTADCLEALVLPHRSGDLAALGRPWPLARRAALIVAGANASLAFYVLSSIALVQKKCFSEIRMRGSSMTMPDSTRVNGSQTLPTCPVDHACVYTIYHEEFPV